MWRWLVVLVTLWPLVYTGLFSLLDIFRNPRLTETSRTVWVVALFLGNMLALPVY